MEPPENLTDAQKKKLWERCQKDPIFYVLHVLGVEKIEDYQIKVLEAISKYERVAVRSCHNMGKTWGAGVAVLWFTPTHPRSKVVSTAPTSRQVRLLLWGEIGAGYKKSVYPLGGDLTTTEWKIQPDWWAAGFTTQKEAAQGQGQANSGFQGIHGEWVFVIFDEATGISPDIWKQLEGLLTSANVRFLALGNPTTKACEFYKCFSDSSFKKIHLSCFDSPNLIANKITCLEDLVREYDKLRELDERERLNRLDSYEVVRPHLLTTKAVMGWALKWGLKHPLFVSKALGEFPDEDESCLMPLGTVVAAQRREPEKGSGKLYIGVDVARKGFDSSLITRLKEFTMLEVKTMVKKRTTEVSGAVIEMVNNLSVKERLAGGVITVDATGIGSGVVDELCEYQKNNLEWRNIRILELHFAETFQPDRDGNEKDCKKRAKRFVNKKAEAFVLLSQELESQLVLLADDVYQEELPTIIYAFNSKGQYVIEDKTAYKKRTGRGSPDHADSLALANYGRYGNSGIGKWDREITKKAGKPLAGRLRGDDDE